MKAKICKICGIDSTSTKWVTSKGSNIGRVCLICHANKAKDLRSTAHGRIAANEASKKNRSTIEGRAKHNAATALYQAQHGRLKHRVTSLAYWRVRLSTDPLFAAKHKLRNSLRSALIRGGFSKNDQTSEKIFGINFEGLMEYLGCKKGIPEGMAIDHILPMALARSEADAITLNHYTNLQLLSTEANLEKSDWVPGIGYRARDLTDEQAAVIINDFRSTIKYV